jgi:hypothetical protein
MKLFLVAVFLSFVLFAGPGARGALADDTDSSNPSLFEQRLKTYDPKLVEAARTYQRTLNMTGQLVKIGPVLSQAIARQVKLKNPSLSDEQIKAFTDAFFQNAFVDHAGVLEQMATLITLDTFTRDELIALNAFYSTPAGQSILGKMPKMMSRMPEIAAVIQKYVVPEALGAAQDQMKKAGVDVKI